MGVAKARLQWTHSFSRELDMTVSAALAGGFGRTSSVTTTVPGLGTLTPVLNTMPIWAEFGARLGYHATDRITVEGFANATVASGLASSIHVGGALHVSF